MAKFGHINLTFYIKIRPEYFPEQWENMENQKYAGIVIILSHIKEENAYCISKLVKTNKENIHKLIYQYIP